MDAEAIRATAGGLGGRTVPMLACRFKENLTPEDFEALGIASPDEDDGASDDAPDAVQDAIRRYDGEIRFVDEQIGRLLAGLETLGLAGTISQTRLLETRREAAKAEAAIRAILEGNTVPETSTEVEILATTRPMEKTEASAQLVDAAVAIGYDLERPHAFETQEELLDPAEAPRVQAHHVPSFMFAGCHLTSLPLMEG